MESDGELDDDDSAHLYAGKDLQSTLLDNDESDDEQVRCFLPLRSFD